MPLVDARHGVGGFELVTYPFVAVTIVAGGVILHVEGRVVERRVTANDVSGRAVPGNG
jgi:hypothetical protein